MLCEGRLTPARLTDARGFRCARRIPDACDLRNAEGSRGEWLHIAAIMSVTAKANEKISSVALHAVATQMSLSRRLVVGLPPLCDGEQEKRQLPRP
jgi:hypothetical protein